MDDTERIAEFAFALVNFWDSARILSWDTADLEQRNRYRQNAGDAMRKLERMAREGFADVVGRATGIDGRAWLFTVLGDVHAVDQYLGYFLCVDDPHGWKAEHAPTLRELLVKINNAQARCTTLQKLMPEAVSPGGTANDVDHQHDDGDVPASLIDDLSPQAATIVSFLWTQKHSTGWDSVAAERGAFRGPPTDEAIERALERVRESLNRNYDRFQLRLEVSKAKRRVRLHRDKTPHK